MIKKIIQYFKSKEQNFCFERHNLLLWYLTIEHPASPVSNNEENPFFNKYGFLIIRDVENICEDHKDVLKFLLFTNPTIKNTKVVFGERNVYFKGTKKFVRLQEKDIFIFDPQRVNISINKKNTFDFFNLLNE